LLEALADNDPFEDVEDPVDWQRQLRLKDTTD